MHLDPSSLDTLLSVALGVALAAAVGFRIFVPLLVLSVASLAGRVELAPSFAWIGTYPALTVFGVATLVEIAAYYVPWLDNVLDWLGAPVAVVAGTVVAASTFTGLDPMLKWVLAVIAGGGAAGAVHGSMALIRKLSSFTTGGLANPLVSTVEAGGSVVLAALAVAVPVLAVLLLITAAAFAGRLILRRRAPQ
jgi:hypothetical protein